MTKEEILAQVPSARRAQAEAFLTRRTELVIPFFVRALIFVGALLSAALLAWVADVLLIGVVPMWAHGVLFMGLGVLLVQSARAYTALQAAWRKQLGELVGLAGQLLLMSGLSQIPGVEMWMSTLFIAVISYPIFKTPFNRFIWCAAAASSLFSQVSYAWKWNAFEVALSAFGAFGVALFIFAKRQFKFYPLAYALIWWCVIGAEATASGKMCGAGLNPANAVLAAAVTLFVCWKHQGKWTGKQLAIAVGAVLLAALLNWPTTLSLMLMYTGFCLRDRLLEGVGTAGVVCGLFLFYFNLNAALSVKAVLLVVSGLILLALRRIYAK